MGSLAAAATAFLNLKPSFISFAPHRIVPRIWPRLCSPCPAFVHRATTTHVARFSTILSQDDGGGDEEEEGEEDSGDDVSEVKLESLLDEAPAPAPQKVKPPGPWRSRFPLLNSKEKKELRAHAHTLGKNLTVQHIGKWGVTPQVTKALSETLEANELIKLRVLENCPNRLSQIRQELEDALEAQVVSKVGRTLVIYRPSIRKFEEDLRKKEVEKRAAATRYQPRRSFSTSSRRPYARRK